ncbi:MAG TPA: cytochrome c3 family protein [Gemmatimonadaceae bacterium]
MNSVAFRAFLLMVTTCFGLAGTSGAQISPGQLAKAHAQLEGALNCTRCHGPRRAAMATACLSCHKEIAWLTERNRGFHAGKEARAKDCASCHPDHAGANFALIAWPGGTQERFDHRAAGWALEGEHRDIKCAECHIAQYRVSEAAALLKRKDGTGWTGLETSCASCHRSDDEHRGGLSAKCDACHDSRGWKPVPRFSHDSTSYALTGKHTELTCNECHLTKRLSVRTDAKGQPIPVYKPVPFRSCADCHEDPHAGRLSPRCGECHTTKGFATVEGRTFNHALTKYPLTGRHARVSCDACHGQNLAKRNPAFTSCASCHSDPHNGKATLAGKPADCAACHRVEGFAPSSFTVAQHASSPYPLEGRHVQVACAKCHVSSPAPGTKPAGVARLRMPFSDCTDCHADSHGDNWRSALIAVRARAVTRLPVGRRARTPWCNTRTCGCGWTAVTPRFRAGPVTARPVPGSPFRYRRPR